MALKEKKHLKTFSIHETHKPTVLSIKKSILQYKHLENILNIILAFEFNIIKNNNNINKDKDKDKDKDKNNKDWVIFKLLLNKIIMKAVLKSNSGGAKTGHNISLVNTYFDSNHPQHNLFKQARVACLNLNDKNVGEIVGRLHKDWNNFFTANSKYYKSKDKSGLQKPSYPKPKSLNKVFNYSVPLEVSKFSMSKEHIGLLGINIETKMKYVKYYNYDKSKPNGNKPSYLNKQINSVTVSLSHGHVYYNLQYIPSSISNNNDLNINKDINSLDNKKNNTKKEKVAGLDIGIHNIASIFINDDDSNSLIISGKELISYNSNYNKRLSNNAVALSNQVTSFKTIINNKDNNNDIDIDIDNNKKEYKIPDRYSHIGRILKTRRSQLFERRKLFMEDYLHKLAKKITQYLISNEVTKLVISRNLSFTKTTGSINMGKVMKQKFYQIPFGRLLNLIESKVEEAEIKVIDINEAYTSKASALTADVVEIQKKSVNKLKIVPTDLNGSRGSKKKGNLNNPLGRGLFKDNVLKKIVNADLNAAANHIKLGNIGIKLNNNLKKYNNPIKIKSNNEFDKLLNIIKSNSRYTVNLN